MNILITLLTCCVVVFLYLHVVYQLKTCDDLELYEIDVPTKCKLEDICDVRQPILFAYDFQIDMTDYGAFDVNITDNTPTKVILPLEKANELFKKSTTYFSEQNSEFLRDTTLVKKYASSDAMLRPYMVSGIKYDLIFGSAGTHTTLCYSNHYRNYFAVTNGDAVVKLTPPKNTNYLYSRVDYERQEYLSEVNPWNPDPKHTTVNKVKFLEVNVKQGQVLHVPPYWWYSIKFGSNAQIAVFQYRTYMNFVSVLPDICRGILQRNNVTIKNMKPVL